MSQKSGRLIRLSWIVFVHAVLVSLESIAIEWLTVRAGIQPLTLSAISITIAGAAFMAGVIIRSNNSIAQYAHVFVHSWKYLLSGSALVTIGLITWYDAVSRIGASKEALLAGPLETVVIVLLARAVLSERLGRIQLLGVAIALGGFVASLGSGSDIIDSSTSAFFSLGDVEAIASAFAFGCGIIIVTKLTPTYSSTIITPPLLLISGLVLSAALPFVGVGPLSSNGFGLIVLFATLPLGAAFAYVVGLARIGPSLTSTIASFSIVIVLAIQVLLRTAGYNQLLPNNLALAVLGGIMAVFGIYLIHREPVPEVGYATRQPL